VYLAADVANSVPWIFENVWLIPAIPAVSFLLIIAFGKRLKYQGAEIGLGSIAAIFILALVATFTWIGEIESSGSSEDSSSEALRHSQLDWESPSEASAESENSVVLTAGEEEVRGAPVITEWEWFSIGGDSSAVIAHDSPVIPREDAESQSQSAESQSQSDSLTPVALKADDESQAPKAIESDSPDFGIGTWVDGQSIMMLFVVTFISGLVHVYSTDYVNGDRRYTHYFAFLSLFTASMLFMVLSTSTLQLIVGWELVGVCSFALIGHWWEEKPNSDAALKAFLTNRVGDMGLLVGMIILFFAAGRTFSIEKINQMAVLSGQEGGISKGYLTAAALCLMAAVMSKSGQFILHTWLPDAMAGPTPVSALIHAATMVVAGVYMIGRLYPVFWEGLSISGSNINAMAFIGGLTTVGGGLLAFVQRDIKKVLAYSTVSQLGYMVLALGMGAYTAGMFHLFTHAFFKACLFLGAGSLSHACHHSFDMKSDMGGLRKIMPKTFATFMIGTAALAGIPPLAGFWSKDEILTGAGVWPGTGGNGTYTIPFIFGIITAALTAAYMTRVIWLTFFGEYRGHHHPHENGSRITVPLIILAAMASVVGFLNMPSGVVKFFKLPESWAHKFEDWVEPEGVTTFVSKANNNFTHAKPSLTLAIFATSVGLIAGFAVWQYYKKLYAKDPKATEYTDSWASKVPLIGSAHKVLENKYYLDHLYSGIITGFTKGPLARAAYWVNQNVLDAIVNFVGKNSAAFGRALYKYVDQGIIDKTINSAGLATSDSGKTLRQMQSGQVRHYASLMFGAAVLVAIVFIFGVSK